MRRRILVVDENPDNATVIRMALDDAHDVVVVNDREAAEQALATHPEPDLLVLDYGLPDGWGLSLCRAVKRTRPTLPIIILTAVTTWSPIRIPAPTSCWRSPSSRTSCESRATVSSRARLSSRQFAEASHRSAQQRVGVRAATV